jgi:hypothetical protein
VEISVTGILFLNTIRLKAVLLYKSDITTESFGFVRIELEKSIMKGSAGEIVLLIAL